MLSIVFNKTNILLAMLIVLLCSSCVKQDRLSHALSLAGANRCELEAVLEHYSTLEPNKEKYSAAAFLIENLAGHYSYANDSIEQYYDIADDLLSSKLSPEQQRDSLLHVSDSIYFKFKNYTVQDSKVITAEYLISAIDKSYNQWKTSTWASHVCFDDFCEWILPYKAVELQSLDNWRDTLSFYFTEDLSNLYPDDTEYGTTMKTADVIKNEVQRKVQRYGLYTREGLPLLSDRLLHRQTFGDIPDYALLGLLTMRAIGIPVVLDETPVGARHEAASTWFVVLGDRGTEEPSEWDLSTGIGWGFFPFERGPKVYRNTFAINPSRKEYLEKSKFAYPFELCKKDVTDKYFLTSDIEIKIEKEDRIKLKERYVYIASCVRQQPDYFQTRRSSVNLNEWQIVDFGTIRKNTVYFNNMGREVLYRVFGFDGKELIPITQPFILHKNGNIEHISADTLMSPALNKWKNNIIIN